MRKKHATLNQMNLKRPTPINEDHHTFSDVFLRFQKKNFRTSFHY